MNVQVKDSRSCIEIEAFSYGNIFAQKYAGREIFPPNSRASGTDYREPQPRRPYLFDKPCLQVTLFPVFRRHCSYRNVRRDKSSNRERIKSRVFTMIPPPCCSRSGRLLLPRDSLAEPTVYHHHHHHYQHQQEWHQPQQRQNTHQEAQQKQRRQQQKQQLQQQHLVEFQGRTLCVTSPSRTSSVLQAVFTALNVSESAAASLVVPWRIMCGGKFLGPDEDAPPLSVLRVWTGGLKGGKGGFGAMLRAMAKQVRSDDAMGKSKGGKGGGRAREGTGGETRGLAELCSMLCALHCAFFGGGRSWCIAVRRVDRTNL